jgi:dTDP-4-dehydrorhamnose 3,5-epimerase
MDLPKGVRLHRLPRFDDERGSLCEIFGRQAAPRLAPLQWNLVRSSPNTLRGMHVHLDRADYILMLKGRMRIGLRDLRAESVTFGNTVMLELDSDDLRAIEIPVGVLHGFYFPEAGVHVYGLSAYWEPNTDIGCRWDDADLGIDWGVFDPVVHERDLNFGSLGGLLARCAPLRDMRGD